MPLAPGTRLGPYLIESALGAGGMGEVYKARDTRLDRTVAIKILRPRAGVDAARQLLAEARAAARLNHPNIATLHDVVDGRVVDGVEQPPFLVMEYVDGEPLSALVAAGPCDVDRAIDIAIQLANALATAHRDGIIHRDVKPSNVMLTPDGAVKLLDLGIARITRSDPAAETRTSVDGPAGPQWQGTPAYMPPEQFGGRPPDARGDVYSAGVLIFELLTGERPFPARDPASIALMVATTPTPRVSSRRPDVPKPLDQVVARAMAKDLTDRYPSAAELRDALLDVRATGTARVARLLRKRSVQTIAASIVIVAAAGIWFARPTHHAPGPIAILPAVATGNAVLDNLGVGLVSMLADNLASVPGLTIVPATGVAAAYRSAGRNVSKAASELGTGYVIDLQISSAGANVQVQGSLVAAGRAAPIWHGSYESDPLGVDRWVCDQVATALEANGVFPQRLTAADRLKLRALPTADAEAFTAYAQGQAALGTAKSAADIQHVIAAFEHAVHRDRSFALAHAGLSEALGRMYSLTKDPAWMARAADEANQALAIDPGRAQVHYSLARVYEDTGRLEEALQHAQQAVQLSPTNDEAHRLLGLVLADKGETDNAIAELHLAIQLRPNFARHHATLGYVLYQAARYADAVAPYRRATELQPTSSNFQMLGTALHKSGNVQEAIGNYKHAVELGQDPKAYSNLAFSYYSAGRFAEALANWQQAVRLDPAPPPTRFRNLGDAFMRLGQTDNARAAFSEAIARAEVLLKTNPADVDQIGVIAVCLAKLGRRDEAALRAAEALGLKPTDNEVLYRVAVVEAFAGQVDQALAHLKDALARGYPRAFARDDVDLQPLRNRPQFAPLVAQRDE